MTKHTYQESAPGEAARHRPELGILTIEAPSAIGGAQIRLCAPEETIGRQGTALLDSPTVSRLHARVWVVDNQVRIADLGSVNGTTVNGAPITEPQPLRSGDRIGLGDVQAVFHPPSVNPAPYPRQPRPAVVPDRAMPDPAYSDSTRFLSAGVHLFPDFREEVLTATVRERHRALAPSPGVDIGAVAKHALLARRRAILRDAVLLVILATAVTIIALTAANKWKSLDTSDVVALALLGMGFLLATWIVVAVETWLRLSTLGKYLRPGGRPDLLPLRFNQRTKDALTGLADANTGNVVVYRAYEPFVGSGIQVDSDAYSIPLLPRDSAATPNGDDAATSPTIQQQLFTTNELVSEIRTGLKEVGVPGLRVDRQLFVEGFDVARFGELLPFPRARPITSAPAALLDELTEWPSGAVRPYLSAQFTGWKGELVVTTFIRVVLLNGLLFVETATYVLGPLRNKFLAVDAMRIRSGPERFGTTIVEATQRLVPALLGAPFRLLGAAGDRRRAGAAEREFKRRLREQVQIDRGATSSIRQRAARERFDRYFMQLDAEMAVSVVRQKVADTIAAFLAKHGYQLDKITMIQNNIVNDNSFRMDNVHGSFTGVGNNARGKVSANNQQNPGKGGS